MTGCTFCSYTTSSQATCKNTCLEVCAKYTALRRRIQVTVVDVYGQRHVLRALTGHTLVDVLQEHSELLGDEGR